MRARDAAGVKAAATPKHIAWVFPGFGVGGAQVRFASLANRMGGACRHSIVSLNGDIACRERLDLSLDVAFPPSGHAPRRMVGAIRHARRFLRDASPDLVVTSNWGAIEWAGGARLAGIAHLHTEDGFGPEERTRQIPRRALTRRIVLRGSTVVLPSQTLHAIATGIWRLKPRTLHVIPNGIDPHRFSAAEPMPLKPGEGPVIGTIAALRPEKNIARLLHAFAALRAQRPARLLIVGDGPERAGLEALAETLGIAADIQFAGHTTRSERWLASMDVFALSSDTEQMPISLLEAMASGLPAICTDVGDVRLMLPPASAAQIVKPDAAALAAALTALLDGDPASAGAANRERAIHHYDQKTMFKSWAALLGIAPDNLEEKSF